MATTTRLAGSTTTMRSSNFTNLWPRTSGISRVTLAGKSCIATPLGSASASAGAGAGATGHPRGASRLVDAAALLVAEREPRALAGRRDAAGGLVHGRNIRV